MILVLAGVNGAGKSSIGGANLLQSELNWYNPDEEARRLHQRNPQRRAREIYRSVLARRISAA